MGSSEELHKRRQAAVSLGVSSMLSSYVDTASGGTLTDVDGRLWIDFGSGIAVTSVGNSAPRVVEAVRAQVERFTHTCFMVTPYESYVAELARHDPSFDQLQWGGQAHTAPYVDLWKEYHALAAKVTAGETAPAAFAEEVASIREKLQPVYAELNSRLQWMAQVFNGAAADLTAATRRAR